MAETGFHLVIIYSVFYCLLFLMVFYKVLKSGSHTSLICGKMISEYLLGDIIAYFSAERNIAKFN